MRHLAAAAAALGFVALTLAQGAVGAAEEDGTPHLLTRDELNAPERPDGAPLILRGSAVGREAEEEAPGAAGWQVVAGRRLWLFDPVTQDLLACRVRRTTLVGVREIRCLSGTAGRFRRTFGPDFQP